MGPSPSNTVFIVDGDASVRGLCRAALEARGYKTRDFQSAEAAVRRLGEGACAVCVDATGDAKEVREALAAMKGAAPDVPVILLAEEGEERAAAELLPSGGFDFVTKPIQLEGIVRAVGKASDYFALACEVRRLRDELQGRFGLDSMSAHSASMQRLMKQVSKVLDNDLAVLVAGEGGTGKEFLARAIHYNGARSSRPFVDMSCAMTAPQAQMSELFGYERGALPGARNAGPGRFERAEGGTLFLDDVGRLTPEVQARLSRALQEQSFERVGGKDRIRLDVRLICSTSEDLERAVQEGRFRADLLHRIGTFPVVMPPLRDRAEDLPVLVDEFLRIYAEKAGKPVGSFTGEAMSKLLEYRWPGNVRELESVVYRAVVLAQGSTLDVSALPPEIVEPTSMGELRLVDEVMGDDEIVPFEEVEKRAIQRALRLTGGNISKAARELKIGRATFYRKLEKYDLEREAV